MQRIEFPANPPTMTKNILLINGPNLNLLGTREPELYGHETLADVERLCKQHAQSKGMQLDAFQSNHEGVIVDKIQEARGVYSQIIMNPGAYTHTSVAIRDAIIGTEAKVWEIHISNIYEREEFRHHSYVTDVAQSAIVGKGIKGYIEAIDQIAAVVDQ